MRLRSHSPSKQFSGLLLKDVKDITLLMDWKNEPVNCAFAQAPALFAGIRVKCKEMPGNKLPFALE
jgi:hypothetical protein